MNLPDFVLSQAFDTFKEHTFRNVPVRTYNRVDEELKILLNAVKDDKIVGEWRTDPMSFYLSNNINLQLVQKVARDLFSVPCGDAPSERVFSIASRVISLLQSNMSP